MEYSLTIHPVIPVRREADERSEMVTQLLFGEVFSVVEKTEKWCRIKNHADGYEGWIDAKMAFEITEIQYREIISSPSPSYVLSSFAKVQDISSPSFMILTAGSRLPYYNSREKTFRIGSRFFLLLEGEVCEPLQTTVLPCDCAESFLEIPYLWGGKNIFGIDCSGFVQIVMTFAGVFLPRDAKDQYRMGREVVYEEVLPNDLAFFGTQKDKITHVGIVLENKQIIHASGKVKIDSFTREGIFSDEKQLLTHPLQGIKRLM